MSGHDAYSYLLPGPASSKILLATSACNLLSTGCTGSDVIATKIQATAGHKYNNIAMLRIVPYVASISIPLQLSSVVVTTSDVVFFCTIKKSLANSQAIYKLRIILDYSC